MTATDSIDSDTREMLKLIVENHPRVDAMQCLTKAAFHTVGKYDAETVLNAIHDIRGENYTEETDSVDTTPVDATKEPAPDDQSDEGEERLDLGEFYYTPAKLNKKSPVRPFGGWPIDPDDRYVYNANDIPEIDWPMSRWLIVGNCDESLLVIDNDSYKLDDATERERREEWVKQSHGKTTVVKSQSGGDHLYYIYEGDPDNIPPEAEHVDLKGCVNKGCAMVPWGEYDLVSDVPPKHITADELREMPFFAESEPEPKPEARLKRELKPTTPRSELIELETTTDYQDIFDAAVQLLPEDVPTLQSHYVSDGTDAENWYPAYRKTKSGESLAYWGNGLFLDREENKTTFGTIDLYAAEQGIINKPYDSLEGENWHEAIEQAREDGAPIPKYESSGPGKVEPKICEPPAIDPETVDIDERRREIDARYDEFLKNRGISTFADIQGMGKTTTAMRAAADRDRKHAVLFSTHQKAHETLHDDDKPDGYLHLKGPSQPHYDQCMGAECTNNPCPDHGPPATVHVCARCMNWLLMTHDE